MNAVFFLCLLSVQFLLGFKALPTVLFPIPDNYSVVANFLVFVPLFWIYYSQRGFRAFVLGGLGLIAVFLPASLYVIDPHSPFREGVYLFLMSMCLLFLIGGAIGLLIVRLTRTFRKTSLVLAPVVIETFYFILVQLGPYSGILPPPSMSPSSSLVVFPPLIQMASFTGVFGVDFQVLFVASLIAFAAWEATLRWPWLRAALRIREDEQPLAQRSLLISGGIGAAVLLGLATLFLAGNLEAQKMARLQKHSPKTLTIALIQPNLAMYNNLRIRSVRETSYLTQYRKLMHEASRQRADLLVFPEDIWNGSLPQEEHFWQSFRGLVREVKCYAIAGMMTQTDNTHLYNMWYHLGRQGEILGTYQKRYLIGFGEYIPYRPFVESLIGLLNHVLIRNYRILKLEPVTKPSMDVSPGKSEKLFTQDQAGYFIKICDEFSFPQFVRQGVLLGGEVIFSPSSGEWFRTPLYLRHFFAIACFRAVETRRWIGRTANYSNAFWVDAQGCLRSSSPYNARAVLITRVPMLDYQTFYVRFGDLFAWSCLGLSLGALLWSLACTFFARPPKA